MKKIILFVCFFTSLTFVAQATHLMGGDITIQDLGNKEYQVVLVAYRDTVGVQMTPSAIMEYKGPNGQTFTTNTLYHQIISGNLLPMYPYGVEIYVFIDTVTLPTYGQWDVSWINCCRNGAIQNLSTPLNENMLLTTTIVTDSLAPNSSPFFLVPAAIFLPQNTPWQYNPLPFDPDGDSLYWSIDVPLGSNGQPCAGYVDPSSDTSNVFSIDPITGTISWTADMLGNFVASVLVDQYRNGIWVGEIRRDMQFIVVNPNLGFPLWNNLNILPRDANNNFALDVPAGIPFSIELITSHSSSNKTVYMGAFSEVFEIPQSNASFTETRTNVNTKGVFSWEPRITDVRKKPYSVVFRVSDGFFTDDKSVLLNVNSSIGLEEKDLGTGLKMYPNPASKRAFIEINDVPEQRISVEVYAINGQKIEEQKDIQTAKGLNVFALNTDLWKPGMYVIHVSGTKGVTFREILVIE